MIKWTLCILALLVAASSVSFAQAGDVSEILLEKALDYVAGFYSADINRVDRALLPDLAKRAIGKHPKTGRNIINDMSKSTLLKIARGNTETARSKATQDKIDKIKVTILDIDGDIDSVKISSPDFIDYVHLGKWNGDWKIINVFWRQVK